MSGLAGLVEDAQSIEYSSIPGFPRSTVEGHGNVLVFGKLEGKNVVVMKGRFHFYEGYRATDVSIGVRVFAALGVKVLLVTNAAGGVNAGYKVGDVMVINDHISFPGLAGIHPLVGHNDDRFGPRFFPMTNTYTPQLQELVFASAAALPAGVFDRTLRRGVYVNVSGPSYETRAEIGLMRKLGGDAVGMSTAFEVLEAAHAGMQVLGLSLITNECVAPGDDKIPPVHEEVLLVAEQAKTGFTALVKKVVNSMDTAPFPVPKALTTIGSSSAAAATSTAAASAAAPCDAGRKLAIGPCCSVAAGGAGCGCGAGSTSQLVAAATIGGVIGAVVAIGAMVFLHKRR